jgi:hypothetical protein
MHGASPDFRLGLPWRAGDGRAAWVVTGMGITVRRESVAADEQANDEGENQASDEKFLSLHGI